MGRLPFDPSRMSGPPSATARDPDRPVPVAVLASMIDGALKSGLPASVRVIGEISNFNERTHWYFRVKDEEAAVDCVMFASAAKRVRHRPENGHKVILTGRVEFYPKQGRTQLYVTALEPAGEGELERRFRELCDRLRERGWFDPERKRPLPSFPRRVAIVTSATGAALQDVLITMKRRCPAVEAAVVDVRVQGDGAVKQIAEAIEWISRHHERLGIDALIVTRGGGSIEDLWAFNEEAVASAIVRCAVPVVAAIGHETDVTIAELVADERCATPTQAAVRLTPDRAALAEEVDRQAAMIRAQLVRRFERERLGADGAARRLAHSALQRVSAQHLRVERLASRLSRLRPEAVHAARRTAVSELHHRLAAAVRARVRETDLAPLVRGLVEALDSAVTRRRDRLVALERELIVAGPASVLARGYSVTTRADGSVVRAAASIRTGETVRTRVSDGSFDSVVGRSAAAPGLVASSPLPARLPSSARRGRTPRNQMDLF